MKHVSFIPSYEQSIKKLLTLCCRLSREAWSDYSTSTRGNSKYKWQNMLTEITNMEYMVVKCRSVIKKLYPDTDNFENDVRFWIHQRPDSHNYMIFFPSYFSQEASVVKSLLSGHEVQLNEGAFGALSQQILRLFTEVKLIQSAQNEDLDNVPIVNCLYFPPQKIKVENSFFSHFTDSSGSNRKRVYSPCLWSNVPCCWHWWTTILEVCEHFHSKFLEKIERVQFHHSIYF